ncbi:MAG: transcriptional repressor [Firmicutes bacterium]|nr:transcriptional repressor [Oscillospiraceae bacterium]MBS5433328.1 transcriptional repressor [Bacillota bacterium]
MDVKRKNSRKRAAILEALAAVTEHPTAEMLYNRLKPRYPELSLGTVYRNLSVLAEEGLVVTVARVDGQERYDARTEPHAHFVCRGCRRVLDLDLPEGSAAALYGSVFSKLGCRAERFELNVKGLCGDCAKGSF